MPGEDSSVSSPADYCTTSQCTLSIASAVGCVVLGVNIMQCLSEWVALFRDIVLETGF